MNDLVGNNFEYLWLLKVSYFLVDNNLSLGYISQLAMLNKSYKGNWNF